MLSSSKPIKFTRKETSGASWITTIKPDYYLARSNSTFDFHPRYYVTEGYRDIGTRDLTKITLENTQAFGYPTRKVPAPLGDVAYTVPRSGNQPTVVATHNPGTEPVPLEYVPVSLGGKMIAGSGVDDTVKLMDPDTGELVDTKMTRMEYNYKAARKQAAMQNDPRGLQLTSKDMSTGIFPSMLDPSGQGFSGMSSQAPGTRPTAGYGN